MSQFRKSDPIAQKLESTKNMDSQGLGPPDEASKRLATFSTFLLLCLLSNGNMKRKLIRVKS